jgi:hypothetical protein
MLSVSMIIRRLRPHVGFGSLADISERNRHVRFTFKSGGQAAHQHMVESDLLVLPVPVGN